MGDYQKIFLILDPSRLQTPAFRRAMELARKSGAHLHLGLYDTPALSAETYLDEALVEQLQGSYRREREHWLDGIARKLTKDGVFTSTEVDARTPMHEAIVERVLELSPDLVIKDVHHEPALSRILFTPLDWHLLRLCPSPLLLVSARKDHWPRHVVVAVDTLLASDGGLNDRIVAEALRLTLQFGGWPHLVHAFEGVPITAGPAVENFEGIALAWQQLARMDRERFEEFAARHGVPTERRHLLSGPSASTLAKYAREASADLVVLGTVYRTGLDRLLLGSTAERLLSLVHCDVLAVQPEGFKADLARHLGLAPRAVKQAA